MSRLPYAISAAARVDLLHIWNYLADNTSVEMADRVLAEIKTGIKKIAQFPGIGHKRLDLTARDVRFYRIHSFLIVYRSDRKPLQVLRVVHAARDVKRLLEE